MSDLNDFGNFHSAQVGVRIRYSSPRGAQYREPPQ